MDLQYTLAQYCSTPQILHPTPSLLGHLLSYNKHPENLVVDRWPYDMYRWPSQ